MDVLSAHRRPAGCGIMGVGWRVEFVGMHTLSGELKCPKVYNEAIVNPRNPSNIKSPPFLRRALSQRRPERPLPLPCLTKSHNGREPYEVIVAVAARSLHALRLLKSD